MYRYKMTKNQCLLKAFNATMALLLLGLICMPLLFHPPRSGWVPLALGMLALAAEAGINWYRWLAYDKQ